MPNNFFEHREIIATHLLVFIRSRGYSRLSFCKLTSIPRSEVDQLLHSDYSEPDAYNSRISQITDAFDLPYDYFLTTDYANFSTMNHDTDKPERSMLAQEFLDGLDNVMDIYSMYIE